MNSISFLGASGEVTGSSFLLTSEKNTQILVDFGMFQGPKEIADLNYLPLRFTPSKLQGVLLTHAHLDHCGRLPLLAYTGFSGKICMTAPTRSLIEVILTDAAKITQETGDPLYGPDQVHKVLDMVEVIEYDKQISVGDFVITFRDAGHILGSASIEVQDIINKKIFVFSGDLGNTPEDIVRPTTYINAADVVVMESTYGDSMHPVEDPTQILMEEINFIETDGGVLLIPAFSIERTQDLLHRIHHLKKEGKVRADTPVFLDSPMGIHATVIFKDFKEFYNDELKSHTDDPFSFEGLVITQDPKDSKEILGAMEPKVIIAGSGMISGGRILHHAINYLPQDSTRLLFVGYQAEETLGRKILEGAKNAHIHNTHIKIRAKIREIKSFSSHADQPKLLTWLRHIKGVTEVFLVHGDTSQRKTFAEKIVEHIGLKKITLPENGQTFDL
jgi:metallo-beta-lactamase family protein